MSLKLNYIFAGFLVLIVIAVVTYQRSLPTDEELVDYCCKILCSQEHPNWSRTQLHTYCFEKGNRYWEAVKKYDIGVDSLPTGVPCHHSYGPETPDGKVSAWEFLCWRKETESISDKMAEFCGCPVNEIR